MKVFILGFVFIAYTWAQFYPGYPLHPWPAVQYYASEIISHPTVSVNNKAAEITDDAATLLNKTSTPSCDCSIVVGTYQTGCKITTAAPPGFRCQCRLGSTGLSCSGNILACPDANDPLCKAPDTSIQSCFYGGGGDCFGYSTPSGTSCSCKYNSHGAFSSCGCYIAKPAPPYYACHCDYAGFWTCSGKVIVNNKCNGNMDTSCLNPGKTITDCQLAIAQGSWAKPDCGGYPL